MGGMTVPAAPPTTLLECDDVAEAKQEVAPELADEGKAQAAVVDDGEHVACTLEAEAAAGEVVTVSRGLQIRAQQICASARLDDDGSSQTAGGESGAFASTAGGGDSSAFEVGGDVAFDGDINAGHVATTHGGDGPDAEAWAVPTPAAMGEAFGELADEFEEQGATSNEQKPAPPAALPELDPTPTTREMLEETEDATLVATVPEDAAANCKPAPQTDAPFEALPNLSVANAL